MSVPKEGSDRKRNWFRRPRNWILGGGVVAVVAIVAIAAANDSSESSSTTVQTTVATTTTVVESPDTPTPTASTTVAADEPVEYQSADRLLFWAACDSVIELTDADLDRLMSQGVDGFVCSVARVRGLGGQKAFTPDPSASLEGDAFTMQRQLRDTAIVARATERGMKVYLGFYATNDTNQQTPFVEWFDDQKWNEEALPNLTDLAATARQLGFAGLAIDQEIYSHGRDAANWTWNYPGNSRPESEVRAKVKQRGAQMMEAFLEGFPGVEVLAYATLFPGTWEDLVQLDINGITDRAAPMVHINFWDGMTSVEGYEAVRYIDAIFYKTKHLREATWDTAFTYEYNRLASVLSRSFSNWDYASSRVFASPFVWISEGGTRFEQAYEPEYVAEQLEAYSQWGMGGEFANYAYNGVEVFDYTPYVEGMLHASTPRLVDQQPPQLEVDSDPVVSSGSSGATAALTGTATDDFAVWVVRWANDRGGSGTAQLTWEPGDGDLSTGWDDWQMVWSIDSIPLQPGVNTITITAEGTKGPSTSTVVTASA